MVHRKATELRGLLTPYVHTFTERKYDVEEEDVESLIRFASSFGVLDQVLEEVRLHSGKDEETQPNAFWDFFKLIPDGLSPGDDGTDLLNADR